MKQKIAILGGGLGSCAAAYWLTAQDGWQDRYDITLYQMGWRLGGKGASAREMEPGYGHRIEEHGLHIWFGFYQNGFQTMRAAFAELATIQPPPVATFATWTDAFTPQSLVTLEEEWQGAWSEWSLLFPLNGDTPGTGKEIDLWDAMVDLLGWLREAYDQLHAAGHPVIAAIHDRIKPPALPDWVVTVANDAGSEPTILHLVRTVADAIDGHAEQARHDWLADLIRAYLDVVWELCKDHLDDTELRRFFMLQDLGGTSVIGILRQRLVENGFESADDRDFIEWLAYFGAQSITQTSPPVQTVYDLVFGFERGEAGVPDFAAGTCIRGCLRMVFTYKGALMWKMMAGMGDTIFTPFYGVLRHRGVKFEFFHKVDELVLDAADPTTIAAVRMTKQVDLTPAAAAAGYWPFVRVKDLDCWPDVPDWKQIKDADKLQHDPYNPGEPYDLESYWTAWPGVGEVVLQRGTDFDHVLFGISIGAVPYLCKQLVAANPAWAAMVNGTPEHAAVKTTQTQGMQLWLTKTAQQLGWVIPEWAIEAEKQTGRPMGLSAVVGGYAQDLDTWADMSHLLPVEDWAPADAPASVAYLCGPFADAPGDHPFTDHAFPAQEMARMRAAAATWSSANFGHLWPNGTSPQHPTGLDPALLVDPEGRTGDARWDAQFYRVNIDPTERYVLSVKGSTGTRLQAGKTGFTNLTITGDWIDNSVLNAGCVEATVTAGMEAAQAISGQAMPIVGDSDTARRR